MDVSGRNFKGQITPVQNQPCVALSPTDSSSFCIVSVAEISENYTGNIPLEISENELTLLS